MRMDFGTNKLWTGVALSLLVGCGGPALETGAMDVASAESALTVANGTNLNGTNLNGTNLNGTNLNGTNLNGTNLNGQDLSGTVVAVHFAGARADGTAGSELDRVELRGSELIAFRGEQLLQGADLQGARFVGETGDGSQVELALEAVASDASGDVWGYRVSAWSAGAQAWTSLCTNASGEAVDAIAVAGRWDYRAGVPTGGAHTDDPAVFTFGCEGAAIAKCVHMGYRPWAAAADGTSLQPLHQACTRLIRADYCGDGTSYTVNGQLVNVYDACGVQVDTEEWPIEAEWDTDGARCVTGDNRAHEAIACADAKSLPTCGELASFSSGTLLMSEVPPKQ